MPALLLATHILSAGFLAILNQRIARQQRDGLMTIYLVALGTAVLLLAPTVVWAAHRTGTEVESSLPLCALVGVAFLLAGAGHSAMTSMRQHAQRVLPQIVFAPLVRLNVLFVVLASVFLLGEQRSTLEALGIGLTFIPLVLVHRASRSPSGPVAGFARGVLLVVLSAATAAGLQIFAKVLVDPQFGLAVPAVVLVFGNSMGGVLVTGVLRTARREPIHVSGSLLWTCLLAALMNAIAFVSLTVLLSLWDASRVYPLTAMSLLVPVGWSILAGHDRWPDRYETVSFLSAFAAILLLT